jgi:hypothetical protein
MRHANKRYTFGAHRHVTSIRPGIQPIFQVVGELLKVDHDRALGLKDVRQVRLPFSEAPIQFTPWIYTEEKVIGSGELPFGYKLARKSMRVKVRYQENHVAEHSDHSSSNQEVRGQFLSFDWSYVGP